VGRGRKEKHLVGEGAEQVRLAAHVNRWNFTQHFICVDAQFCCECIRAGTIEYQWLWLGSRADAYYEQMSQCVSQCG